MQQRKTNKEKSERNENPLHSNKGNAKFITELKGEMTKEKKKKDTKMIRPRVLSILYSSDQDYFYYYSNWLYFRRFHLFSVLLLLLPLLSSVFSPFTMCCCRLVFCVSFCTLSTSTFARVCMLNDICDSFFFFFLPFPFLFGIILLFIYY